METPHLGVKYTEGKKNVHFSAEIGLLDQYEIGPWLLWITKELSMMQYTMARHGPVSRWSAMPSFHGVGLSMPRIHWDLLPVSMLLDLK